MSFLRNKDKQKPEYTGLQISTSTATLPIPIVWGQNKVAHNVIFYNNFQSHKGGSKTGKGGGGGSGSSRVTTYTCDLALAICEGPISGFGTAWKNMAVYAGPTGLWMFGFNGTTPQAEWDWFRLFYPGSLLNFAGTAYVAGANVNLGSAASIGNIEWEVYGRFYATGANGADADPAQVIYDFLTNSQYGAGFDASLIDTSSLYAENASVQAYCHATGISFSPALESPTQASSTLTRWLQIINCAAVWSGSVLKFIPYGDTAIAAGLVKTTTVSVVIPPVPTIGFGDSTSTGLWFTYITINPPGGNLTILGIRYATQFYQGPLIYIGPILPTAQSTYGVIGNVIYFSQYDADIAVNITYTYTTAGGFTPNVTPIYDLTDNDFIDDGGEDVDPVTVTRVDPHSLSTVVRLECSSRSNRYSPVPVEVRDQSQIEILGYRPGLSVQAHEICDELNVGPLVAQLILQRQLYIRQTFKFKLDWSYCLLDPMDIITITDAGLGLYQFAVRITSIEEDDHGYLSVTAEELTIGISDAALYPGGTITTPPVDKGVKVGNVNTLPLIYEPPAAYSAAPLVLLGASSSRYDGSADPNWGGANVWASLDGTSYAQTSITLNGVTPQGKVTAYCPAAAGWDSTSTLSVDLTKSGGTLSGTTYAGALGGVTLCLVDNELLAFENATLTAPNCYNLTGLARGLYGTTPAAHGSGASFNRIDTTGPAESLTLPSQWIGATVYLKFQSFNIFGLSLQSLSDCVAYIFTAGAPSVQHPIAKQLLAGLPVDLGSVVDMPTLGDDFGPITDAVTEIIDLGAVAVNAYPIGAQLLAGGPVDFGLTTGAVALSDDFGSPADSVHDVINLGST